MKVEIIDKVMSAHLVDVESMNTVINNIIPLKGFRHQKLGSYPTWINLQSNAENYVKKLFILTEIWFHNRHQNQDDNLPHEQEVF